MTNYPYFGDNDEKWTNDVFRGSKHTGKYSWHNARIAELDKENRKLRQELEEIKINLGMENK